MKTLDPMLLILVAAALGLAFRFQFFLRDRFSSAPPVWSWPSAPPLPPSLSETVLPPSGSCFASFCVKSDI